MPIAAPTLANLTSATLDGAGVFDVLMKANKVHLEEQFDKGRIKGTEYATVYLGSLEQVLNSAVQFLLSKDKIGLEAQLLEQQILLAQTEVAKASAQLAQIQAQTALIDQQTANAIAELAILQQNALKIPAEIAHLNAQTALVGQQQTNLVAEKLGIEAKTTLTIEQHQSEALRNYIDPTDPTKSGAVEQERLVLIAQNCKLKAEFDVLAETKLKTAQESQLLNWKVVTEKAQTSGLGVEDDSVLGKQKLLYAAQTSGFTRDAEQKAAKLMVDSWNVRRTTDEGTVADGTNMLNDAAVGRAVNKLLTGVGA